MIIASARIGYNIDDSWLAGFDHSNRALERWADEELRSLNGQIEYVLRQALAKRQVKIPPPGEQDGKDD